jgi:hypothetical protein
MSNQIKSRLKKCNKQLYKRRNATQLREDETTHNDDKIGTFKRFLSLLSFVIDGVLFNKMKSIKNLVFQE